MILDDIAAYTKERVKTLKERKSLAVMRYEAEACHKGKDFKAALSAKGLNIIAELKKASPSKGLISPNFELFYLRQAEAYERGGAAAISCLTEPKFFLGSDEYLRAVRKVINLPILRKDFIIDIYQIYEAKTLGADAVLLICSLLGKSELKEYLALAHSLELSALVEAHTAEEIETALSAGADIIGVNNRNLKDFSVNPLNSLRLRDKIPRNKIFVAESGIKNAVDVVALKTAGVQAVLVGEALMRASDPEAFLKEMRCE